VTGETGEVRSTNRLGRIRGFISGLHVFAYLAPWMSNRSIQVTMVIAAAAGVAMTLFGAAILWIQLKHWWLARRA
jgi:apolipoprotein N-acyltransferase